MEKRPTLVLVDGHALAFRAFHALKDTGMAVRATGEPTYAIQGFFTILLNLLRERRPEYVAVSFDVGRTFRDDLYADYKAGRGETPSEFHSQLDRMKQIITALNMPIYTAEGYEADDVIGTLCRQAEAQQVETLIITGDTDTLQLVNDWTRVLLANPYVKAGQNTILYDEDQVRERYKGLQPNQLADLRGLKGDTSDNIPGVKGIGEAGAISLLLEFGTVAGIYANLDQAPKRYRTKLEGQQEIAEFSKHLATIVTNVPGIQLDLPATRVHEYDRSAVLALFSELEFRKLVEKLPAVGTPIETVDLPASATQGGPAAQTASGQMTMFPVAAISAPAGGGFGDYRAVQDQAGLAEVVAALAESPQFAFDTETTTTSLYGAQDAQVVGISLATRPGLAWYIPLGHREGAQLSVAEVVAALQPFFSDPAKLRVAHHGKFDVEALGLIGIEVGPLGFDTLIAAALLGLRQSLKELAFSELRDEDNQPIEMTNIEELIGRGKNQITMADVPIEQAAPYACADVDMTLRLMAVFAPRLAQPGQEKVRNILERVELPLVPVLVEMECAGIGVDRAQLARQGEALGRELREIEQQIIQRAGGPVNTSSRFELNDLLFGLLKLPSGGLKRLAGTTKSGGAVYSVTAETLEELKQHDTSGIVELILRQRRLAKLKSTYVDTLQTLINARTGRVHTQFRQMGAETGRLSSDSPNLQNIPVRTEEGREIRRAFVAAPGHVLLAADYSQIELRVLAHVTQDPTLLDVFRTGQDIHASTAAKLYGISQEEVTKNQRRLAKCVAEGTYVTTERGLVRIEQLAQAEPGDVSHLNCVVAQEGVQRSQATGFYNGSTQPTVRITTERGYVLEATPQHRIRSLDEKGDYVWRYLEELEIGSHVAMARGAMMFGADQVFNMVYERRLNHHFEVPEQLTPMFARFLGYFVAEGSYNHGRSNSSIVISNIDQDVLNDLRRISLEIFGTLPSEQVDKNDVTVLRWNSSRLTDLILHLGIASGAENKSVPDCIMQGSYDSVTEFLRAFFEGDGSISSSFISAASKSRTLIQQIQVLLLNLGIVCHLEHRDVPNYGRHYKLRLIGKDSRVLFAKHVGFTSSRKSQRLEELITKTVTNEPITLPLQIDRLQRLYPQTKGDLKELIHTCIRTKSPTISLTYRRLAKILEEFPNQQDADFLALKQHQERNLFYDKVVSIEHDHKQVYDLVVPENNTYVANGFVSHNTVVFGVIYGISAFGLSARTELSRGEAQEMINTLFAQYPGLKEYIDKTLETVRANGYVETLFGRRRYFRDLVEAGGGPRRQAAEREAINAGIQGTAADLIKIAMVRLNTALHERGYAARMLLQVHDELVLEVPEAELPAVASLVHDMMENVYPELRVPLEVNIEAGANWDTLRPIEKNAAAQG